MQFVVICAPRTGSSHLMSSLGLHPEIFANGNILDARRQKLYVFWPKCDVTPTIKSELTDLRTKDPSAFVARIFAANYGKSHVGFKIFRGENDAVLGNLIADKAVRKVILYRRNVLANFSSALIAKETGQYGLRDGAAKVADSGVKFNSDHFIRFHDRYVGFFGRILSDLSSTGQVYHFINYEDVNNPHAIANLVAFLGADPSRKFAAESDDRQHQKQNSSDILSRFSNPSSARRFLRENGLLHWMHEGGFYLGPITPITEALETKKARRTVLTRGGKDESGHTDGA